MPKKKMLGPISEDRWKYTKNSLININYSWTLTKLKLTGKESPIFLRTHGKQHDGRKGMRINPLTAKRNAQPGPGRMSLVAQRSGSTVRSGNYCCSSISVASIDENSNSHRKITMTHTQTTYINRIALRVSKKGARPAEVGALASVFENLATELKQQNLLKCKQTIQIATFNVRTLNHSSSSCRAGSTDIPDPHSPLIPIVHHLRQVFWTTSCILT